MKLPDEPASSDQQRDYVTTDERHGEETKQLIYAAT